MKNILITGISKGLGLKLAEHFSSYEGFYIIGCSRTMTDSLQKLITTHENIEWHPIDLADSSTLERNLTEIIGDRQLNCVVNNAAVLYKSLLVKADISQFENMLRVNLIAPAIVSKVVLNNFLFNKVKGTILFYSSICAHKGFNGLSMIGATKGGVESLSKSISFEYGRKGIRSNVISIGILDTGMSDTVNDNQYADILNQSSLRQATDSISVVELSSYLLSDASKSVTGQVFHVNCGII